MISSIDSTGSETISSELDPRGVKRVILLDSYLPHSRTEVDLVGHTGITGLNGTGKTSHIQLWPLFFGAEPTMLVKADSSGQTKSFIDYYLPGDSSYIVFEFDSAAGTQLACFVTSRDNQSLSIVLISGAYDDDLFLDADDQFLPKDDLRQRARADGRDTHQCRTIKEYRGLLFGDVSTRGRRADLRQFSILAGYPESNRVSMEKIYPILVSTINNSIDERLLRQLLYDQSLREADTRGTQEIGRLNIDIDDLDRWINNYKGLEELRRRSGNAESALTTAARYRELGRQEHVLKVAAERRQKAQQGIRSREQDKLNDLNGQRTREKERFAEARARHEQDRNAVRQRRSDVELRKETLERQRSALEERGIQAQLEIVARYDERARTLESHRNRLSALKSASQNIEAEFAERKEGIRTDYESQKERLEAQRKGVDEAERSERHALDDQHQQEQQALEQRLAEAEQYAAEQLTAAREHLREITTEKRLMAADPELVEKRDEARRQVDEAQQEFEAADQRFREAKAAHDQALADRDKVSSTLTGLRREMRECEEEHATIEERLQREGTLLEYVREQAPDCQESLAAVLAEGRNLLYRKDLSPAPAEHTGESLFGMRIDTAKLGSADIDADERERKVAVEVRIKELKGEIGESQRSEQHLENAKLPELHRARHEAHEALELARGRLSARKEALENAEAAVRASREEKQATMEKRLAEAEEAKRQAEARLQDQKSESDRQRRELRDTQKKARRALESDKAVERAQIDENLTGLQQWRDQQIAEQDDLLDKRRQAEGVDAGEIRKAEQDVKQAGNQVEEAERALSAKREWEDLQARIKEEMPGLEETLRETGQTLARMDRQWADEQSEHEQCLAGIDAAIEESENADRAAKREINALNGVLEAVLKIGEGVPDEATIEAKADLPSTEIQSQFSEVRGQLEEVYQQLRTAAMDVANSIKLSQSPMLQDFNEEVLLSTSAYGESAQDLLAAADSIRALYGDPEQWDRPFNHFPAGTRGSSLEDTVRAGLANKLELGGFLGALKALRTSVKRQASAIESHYKTFLSHLSNIDEIELQVEFDLDRVDGYQAAEQAGKALERYERQRVESGDDRLIPERSVCEALEGLSRYLRNRRHEQRMELIDALDMTFRVTRDGGRDVKQSRRGQTLASAFSTGIGMLVAVVVLVGFLENQRKRFPVTVPWMLDEILKLDPGNTRELLEALKRQHIFLVSTSPDIRAEHDRYFAKRYSLQSVDHQGRRLPSPIFVECRGERVEADPFDVLRERAGADANGTASAAGDTRESRDQEVT